MAVYANYEKIFDVRDKGAWPPWAVFAVIGLRDEKMRSIFSAFEESFGFFCILMVLLDHSDSPSGDRRREVENAARSSDLRQEKVFDLILNASALLERERGSLSQLPLSKPDDFYRAHIFNYDCDPV